MPERERERPAIEQLKAGSVLYIHLYIHVYIHFHLELPPPTADDDAQPSQRSQCAHYCRHKFLTILKKSSSAIRDFIPLVYKVSSPVRI